MLPDFGNPLLQIHDLDDLFYTSETVFCRRQRLYHSKPSSFRAFSEFVRFWVSRFFNTSNICFRLFTPNSLPVSGKISYHKSSWRRQRCCYLPGNQNNANILRLICLDVLKYFYRAVWTNPCKSEPFTPLKDAENYVDSVERSKIN